MLKKFVRLDSEAGPSHTPYNIKTYQSPSYERIPRPLNVDPCCYGPPLKPCKTGKISMAKPMTTEEAIFRLFEIPQDPTFQTSCKKKCKHLASYKTCVMDQRSPEALKHHAVMREKFLLTQMDTMERVHDAKEPSSDELSVVRMDSPIVTDGRVPPKLASPACSLDTFYVPSRRLLDLKRPRSGIFVNETPRPVDSDIPFETYNPRKLQERLENEDRTKYTLLSDGNRFYFPWTQGPDNMGDARWNQAEDAARQDCINFKPVIFPIPTDLNRTFTAAVVFGSSAMRVNVEDIGSSRPVEVACLYAAYVESFTKNPDYWSVKAIDSILETGKELCEKSISHKYQDRKSDFDIIPELTEKQATVEVKLHLTGCLVDEPNILKALSVYFNKFHAGILCSDNHLYFLIWKRCINSFYIFDPNGRDVQCKRDFDNGNSSLMAIQTVEHIVHLILNFSDVDNKAEFNLYEIHFKDFGKLGKPMCFKDVKPPKKLYAVVNRFYAVIPAISGLPAVTAGKTEEDNASMMISYLTLVYSQINPPKQWTMQLVDDLIKFGKQYHGDYVCDYQLRKLNIVDLPEIVLFGNYRVLVEKKSFARSGHVVECWSYRASQLSLAIMDFFRDYNTGLLQIDSTTFALWKEKSMIFVFDSFKRGPAGQATLTSKSGVGCVQIHLNLESLCRILYMNALLIKTEGNFFLHGIHVKAIGTFSINRAMEEAAKFGTLHIKYPFDCEKVKKADDDLPSSDCPPNYKADSINCTLVQCLSNLSVSPCERTCSERDFLQQQKKIKLQEKLGQAPSIHSIPEEFQIPEFDNVDIIDSVVGEFICDLITKIQRKTEKKPKVSIQATKILLQSDKGHLEDLKLRLKRGEDYDNICEAFKTKPAPYRQLTLEEELAIESNFTELFDGTWAIFGVSDLESGNETLKGILATITAAALSCKYNVATWSSDVIEYALEASTILEERFWSYNHTLDLMFRKQIPKIQLGSTSYYIKVLSNDTVVPDKLKDTLSSMLLRVNRLFLICKGLSCLIVKRYNFIYMFMGCACDAFGFRSKSPAPMCLLRFIELGGLVRRIENACGRCGKYVIVQLHIKDITDPKPDKFAQRTASQEELLYGRELTEKERQKQRQKDKMKFIQHELRKETARLKQFEKEKARPPSRRGKRISIKIPQKSSSPMGTEGAEGEGGEEGDIYEVSEESIEFKHKPGKSLENAEEQEVETEPIIIPQLGYQLRDQDCHFKIQGSTALEERFEPFLDKVKTCYFASAIALLYAILRPLNHWDSQRIDKVIHVAENIAKSALNLNTASERIIKNIDVDEFIFQVKVEIYTPPGSFGGNLEYKIIKTIQTHRYFMIQISNVTFAVYHDEYFHLFDPYCSMMTSADEGNDEEEEAGVCPDYIPTHPEQNTASWVLFGDHTTMLQYIGKRASNPEWKTEYQLHIISIISYKTAPKRIHLLNLLTDEMAKCKETSESYNLCTHPEEVEWLDIYPNLVIWSRLNRTNAVQRIRGSALTKDRNFDVEIPNKLFSLWGSIHPISTVFGESRGKQHLAIDVVACCAASVYQVNEWNTQILDSIVINGDYYYNDSIATIDRTDYEISLEHLNTVFEMGHLHFEVHLESMTYGCLYTRAKNELNLAAALMFFFTNNRYGVIQCMRRSLAIGKLDSGFFMFDCQSYGLPLFHTGQGASYVMRAYNLQTLLYCIIMTFNIPYFNAEFTIHKVEMISEKIDAEQAEGEGEDDE